MSGVFFAKKSCLAHKVFFEIPSQLSQKVLDGIDWFSSDSLHITVIRGKSKDHPLDLESIQEAARSIKIDSDILASFQGIEVGVDGAIRAAFKLLDIERKIDTRTFEQYFANFDIDVRVQSHAWCTLGCIGKSDLTDASYISTIKKEFRKIVIDDILINCVDIIYYQDIRLSSYQVIKKIIPGKRNELQLSV
ncbi:MULTISPECIES: hypothetical protein [unclassified Pseudoalteromonas]|uniref:hypothetical protein n=1 Tax=unclassified Pseudoalteromonas TaxID=194690 RepID=UPI0019D17C25|nr:hypothetical protein [Pseudoalteromonas sp. JC3]MBR8843420.1 hypothetical protein [Pseudoalteromonas sp. JC3]WJE11363.1 hypothetical protein QSH61_19760 [Pseudoalteromonas sp. JC3]